MQALAKPSVASGYGALFLCAVTCAHFDDVLHEPLSLVSDWVAGGVLLVGGMLSARDWLRGRAYQAAAWAFMVSLLFRSLVGDLEDALNHAPDPSAAHGLVVLSTGPYVAIKAALFLFAVRTSRSHEDRVVDLLLDTLGKRLGWFEQVRVAQRLGILPNHNRRAIVVVRKFGRRVSGLP